MDEWCGPGLAWVLACSHAFACLVGGLLAHWSLAPLLRQLRANNQRLRQEAEQTRQGIRLVKAETLGNALAIFERPEKEEKKLWNETDVMDTTAPTG